MKGKGPVVYRNRYLKAKKIEAVLRDYLKVSVDGFTMLDIGCGNGDIANFFSEKNDVYTVDVADQRRSINSEVKFSLIASEKLPYDDYFFDIVISNQVIEHVHNHRKHLLEIYRILKQGGICYLATPNKSSPIMEGHKGNQKVLRYKDMFRLFEKSGFDCCEYSVNTLKEPAKYYGEIKFTKMVPKFLLNIIRFIFPSNIFVLVKNLRR